MDLFKEMAEAVIEGDEERTVFLAKEGLAKGVDPTEAIEKGFTEGMMSKLGDVLKNWRSTCQR